VELVLDAPMAAREAVEIGGGERARGEVVAHRGDGLAVALTGCGDLADGGEPRPRGRTNA
jgi:hypothetical protein